ncbi:MAG: hypothetical protein WCB04_07480 [Mycobacteriales bacterium]
MSSARPNQPVEGRVEIAAEELEVGTGRCRAGPNHEPVALGKATQPIGHEVAHAAQNEVSGDGVADATSDGEADPRGQG